MGSITLFVENTYKNEMPQNEFLFELDSYIDKIKDRLSNTNIFNRVEQNINKKKKEFERYQKQLERKLKQYDINIARLKAVINQKKQFIQRSKNKKPEDVGKQLAHEVPTIFGTREGQTAFQKAKAVGKGVLTSLILFVIILFLNTIAFATFYVILGQELLAIALAAIFAAPLTEETGKYLSIKWGATGQFWFIFNAAEFLMYVTHMIAAGVPVLVASFTRLLAIAMHTITMYIMFKVRKYHIEIGENPDAKIGWAAGVIIHFFWNLAAAMPVLTKYA